MAESKTRRIVLLGITGAGKSSLANSIFGKKQFNVYRGFISGTSVSEAKTKSVNGRKLTLIDTPGFFDTNRSVEELKQEIVRCITECSPGPHAFLIVLKVERFTDQEEAVIHRITRYFSEDVFKYATVVFTHGHELPKGKTIKELVKLNKSLSDLVEKCAGRCHVIDNKHWNNRLRCKYRSNKFQLNALLQSIEKTVEASNGTFYTNKMLQEVEKLIQEEERRIAESSENMSKERIRTEAKIRVNKSYIQTASTEIGALLTAFFGGAVPNLLTNLLSSGIVGAIVAAVGTGAAGAGSVGAMVRAAVVEGIVGAVGGRFGYEGHQAAIGAETPLKGTKKAQEDVCLKV